MDRAATVEVSSVCSSMLPRALPSAASRIKLCHAVPAAASCAVLPGLLHAVHAAAAASCIACHDQPAASCTPVPDFFHAMQSFGVSQSQVHAAQKDKRALSKT